LAGGGVGVAVSGYHCGLYNAVVDVARVKTLFPLLSLLVCCLSKSGHSIIAGFVTASGA